MAKSKESSNSGKPKKAKEEKKPKMSHPDKSKTFKHGDGGAGGQEPEKVKGYREGGYVQARGMGAAKRGGMFRKGC